MLPQTVEINTATAAFKRYALVLGRVTAAPPPRCSAAALLGRRAAPPPHCSAAALLGRRTTPLPRCSAAALARYTVVAPTARADGSQGQVRAKRARRPWD